ncbi:MAG: glycosyltransferase family 39 protein [Acidobacteria bacterium]|nr:glycosyltransferase family 39 protein [Acidobacteriota bacterium]
MSHPRPLRNMSRPEWLILLVLLLLAALGRMAALDHPAYWEDEMGTVMNLLALPGGDHEFRPVDHRWFESQPRRDTWAAYHQALFENEDSPYLYFDLIRLWSHCFGLSEPALRSLSALFSLAGVALLALLAWRLLPGRAWLVATALAAVHPYLLELGRDARPYALTLLLAPLSLVLLWRIGRGEAHRWHHATYVVALAALLYTHYFNAFFVGAQLATLLLAWKRSAAWGHGLAAALLFTPGLWVFYTKLTLIRGAERRIWIQAGADSSLGDWFQYALTVPKKMLVGSTFLSSHPLLPVLVVIAGAAALLLVVLGSRRLYHHSPRTALSLGLLVALPVTAVFVSDQVLDLYSIASPRYLIYVFIPLILLMAIPAEKRATRRLQAGLAVVVGLGLMVGLVYYFRSPRLLMDWRVQAEAIAAAVGPEGLVVADKAHSGGCLAWYFPEPRRLACNPDLSTIRRELAGRTGRLLAYLPLKFRPDSLTELPTTRLDPLVREGLLRIERVTSPPNRYRSIIYFRIQNGVRPGAWGGNEKGHPRRDGPNVW